MEASGYTVKHGRGGTISFLVPGQERATRLRASTLGDGYDPEDIKAVIAGERPIPEQPVSVSAAPRRVNLIVDIQERLRSGKGAAYARWAKVKQSRFSASRASCLASSALPYSATAHSFSKSISVLLTAFARRFTS